MLKICQLKYRILIFSKLIMCRLFFNIKSLFLFSRKKVNNFPSNLYNTNLGLTLVCEALSNFSFSSLILSSSCLPRKIYVWTNEIRSQTLAKIVVKRFLNIEEFPSFFFFSFSHYIKRIQIVHASHVQ